MLILGNACLMAKGDPTEELSYHIFICIVWSGKNHLCFFIMVLGSKF